MTVGGTTMSEVKEQPKKEVPLQEGHQPIKKGYQPTQGQLDISNPPQGGTGVPPSSSSENGKADKKD